MGSVLVDVQIIVQRDYWTTPTVQAVEYVLQVCVKTSNANSTNSILSEIELSSWTNNSLTSLDDKGLVGYISIPPPSDCQFFVSYYDTYKIQDALTELLTGNYISQIMFMNFTAGSIGYAQVQTLYDSLSNSTLAFAQ